MLSFNFDELQKGARPKTTWSQEKLARPRAEPAYFRALSNTRSARVRCSATKIAV